MTNPTRKYSVGQRIGTVRLAFYEQEAYGPHTGTWHWLCDCGNIGCQSEASAIRCGNCQNLRNNRRGRGRSRPKNWAVTPPFGSAGRQAAKLFTYQGVTAGLRQIIERFGAKGLTYFAAYDRIRSGWPLEKALTKPPALRTRAHPLQYTNRRAAGRG